MNRLAWLLPLFIAGLLLYFPIAGWRHLHGGETGDDPAARTYGASHAVPGFQWVVVLNAQGVDTADTHIAFFEQCLLRYRGTVHEVTSHYSWYAWWSDDALVEYENPAGVTAAGILCPDGTVFLLADADLRTFGERFAERQAYETRLAREVDAALAAAEPGRPIPVRASLRWVEALNPTGLRSHGYAIAFLDACGIEAGGTIRAIHETSLGTLYSYAPHPEHRFVGVGIPCPEQTVFLLNGTARRYF